MNLFLHHSYFDVKRLENRNIGYQVRKLECHKKCNGNRWWRGGMGALVWRGGAYNDGTTLQAQLL